MRNTLILVFILLSIVLTAGSCSETEDSGPNDSEVGGSDNNSGNDFDTSNNTDSENSDALAAGCDAANRMGTFSILLSDDYTGLSGSVMNGVTPSSVPEVIAESGTCALLGPRQLFCDPACTALGETCGTEGVCVEAPTKQDAGTVTVTGMNTDVSVSPNSITSDYSLVIQDPNPAFNAGANLVLQAEGGVFSPFSLNGKGPSPMTTTATSVTVERGNPVTVTWDAGNVDGTQVHILLDVNVHGARTGWIVCDAADTGSFEIPEALVTPLIDLGLSGFPKIEISRRSIDTTTVGDGCVELIVYSQEKLEVVIPGLASCSDNSDCEAGQTCEEDLVCR